MNCKRACQGLGLLLIGLSACRNEAPVGQKGTGPGQGTTAALATPPPAPQLAVTPPLQVIPSQPQDVTAPSQGVTAPPQGITAPPQGITAPPQGITAPPQGITAPPQGFTIVQARLEPGAFSTQADTAGFRTQALSSGEIYLKLNGHLVPQDFVRAADGGWELAALVASEVFSGAELRVEAGQLKGLAREYLFALPPGPHTRVSLRLFPDELRRAEMALLAAGQSVPNSLVSLNLPALRPAATTAGGCSFEALAVKGLKLSESGGGLELSWEGSAPRYAITLDGALLDETTGRSYRLILTGRHQIGITPKPENCLLPPGIGAQLTYEPGGQP
ncbi:MAG TPA: hypothetical protein V6D23_11230 [Candidatus Obscuribacterales bacterium]